MYRESIQLVRRSIFPIFHFGNMDGKAQIGVLGTGFFIGDNGYFVTAEHVVSALPHGSKFGYLGNIPNLNLRGMKFQHFDILHQDKSKDLAFGRIMNGPLPGLKTANQNAEIGESITLCGYPLPSIKAKRTVNNQGNGKQVNMTFNVSEVRQYWQPTIAMDALKKNNLINKPFDTLISQHASLQGMSGGPIFNLKGEVVGVTSSNMTRMIQRSNGIPLPVENGVGVQLNELKVFLQPLLLKK